MDERERRVELLRQAEGELMREVDRLTRRLVQIEASMARIRASVGRIEAAK